MKNVLIFFIGVLIGGRSFGRTTFVHFEFSASYNVTKGNDSNLFVRVHFYGLPAYFSDSFVASGVIRYSKNYQIPNDWTLQYLEIEFFNSKGLTLGRYRPGNGFNTSNCSGYRIDDPFNSNHCTDFRKDGGGILCGIINYHSVKDNQSDNIAYSFGHWSDPMGIYCAYDFANQESPLQLRRPCYFGYKNPHNGVLWYESPNGTDSWSFISAADTIYPARESYKGGQFFNVKRYYKVVTDTNWVKGIFSSYESAVFGPVRFYLGAKPEKIEKITPKGCNEKEDIVIKYNDSFFSGKFSPMFWVFYKESDTSEEVRYYLGRNLKAPVNIFNVPVLKENGHPHKSNMIDYRPGYYRIRYDFTPWNGFDCKLESVLFKVENKNIDYFEPEFSIENNLRCFGDKNAKLLVSVRGRDTGKYHIIYRNSYSYLPLKLDSLGSGVYSFGFGNGQGCEVTRDIKIDDPEKFFIKLKTDTLLCNGQYLNIVARHPLAVKYLWKWNSSEIGNKDSLTLDSSGNYTITWFNRQECQWTDTVKIRRNDLSVLHDVLIPSKSRLKDTLFAVNVSQPAPDSWIWKFDLPGVKCSLQKNYTLSCKFPDTGYYRLSVQSRFSGCGYLLNKQIQILGDSEQIKLQEKLGYRGPLIQSFSVDPNPNDGYKFKIKIQLRDTANILIYKIDPTSGDIIGDVDMYNKKYYESDAFSDEYCAAGVFYLKLIAGNESKTIKVVVVR